MHDHDTCETLIDRYARMAEQVELAAAMYGHPVNTARLDALDAAWARVLSRCPHAEQLRERRPRGDVAEVLGDLAAMLGGGDSCTPADYGCETHGWTTTDRPCPVGRIPAISARLTHAT